LRRPGRPRRDHRLAASRGGCLQRLRHPWYGRRSRPRPHPAEASSPM